MQGTELMTNQPEAGEWRVFGGILYQGSKRAALQDGFNTEALLELAVHLNAALSTQKNLDSDDYAREMEGLRKELEMVQAALRETEAMLMLISAHIPDAFSEDRPKVGNLIIRNAALLTPQQDVEVKG